AGGAPAPAGAALAAAVVGGARPLVLAGGAGDAAPAPVGNWRVAQEWRGYHYGDVIIPPAGFAGAGTPARGVVSLADGSSLFVEWVAIGDESAFADRAVSPDCRLLPVRLDRAGRPFRTLENLVESCRQEHLPDFIAPRTTMRCLEHLAGEGRSLESHFEHFKKLCGLQDSQWGMEEHASVISYLKALLQHDQVDASNILSVEMMFRRLQTIEYCYSDKLRERTAGSSAGRLTADEQAAFGATARAESRLMVSPALLESAKQELERDASLAKSLLKAREARESLGKRRQGQGKAGVAELTLERPTEVVDCFFVKKGGGKQRLVVDCRRSNQHFEPPAPVSLVSGDTLSQVHGDDSLDQPVFIGQVDIKDAFYHMELPEGLRQYFGLRRIRASWAGISQVQGAAREGRPPRERAFAAAAAQLHGGEGEADRRILMELVRPQSRHHRPESEFDRRHTKAFEDVPLDLLRAPWRVCGRQRWKRASTSMPALEAEALLYGVRHLLRSVANLGSRLLVIGDSISASLAATKARSSCDGMLSVTRRLGALLLGTGSLLRSRWIASELNPADGPSRGRAAPSDPLAGLRRELATAAGEGRNAGARQVRQIEDPRGPPAAAAQCGAQMSLLRRASVSAKTQAQYSLYLAALQRFCDSRGDHPNTEEEWDIATAGLMEIMCMEGGSLSAGEKLLASVQWAEPRLGRLGGGRMPVCRQCLRGWRRAAPAGGRLPLPYDVVALLACWMICQGLRPHALAILMMMEMYLRPGEPFLLRGRDVVAGSLSGAREWTPTSVLLHPFEMRTPSKSQEFDQAIVLDLDRQAALADALVQLGLERGGGPLLDLTPSALRRALDEAAAAWRLGPLGPLDAYRFRHAGASVDFATGARRLGEIQRRGRWRSARSLRRYEHGGRLADLLRRLPPDAQRADAVFGPLRAPTVAVFLELFAGSGHLSDAMERGNVPTLRWDILYGPAYDLRNPRSARLIRGWIRAGLVCGLHAGFPCETFSRARDRPNGPPRLRSQEHVWGLPSLHPESADFQKVKWGNLYARLTISFCVLCCQCFVPWSVENPALSYAWQLPPMLPLLQRRQVTTQVIEHCRFGTPWRKSTRIAAFLLDLAPLAKFRCTGPVCVLTGQRHQELSGKDASGRFRTRLAEAYPCKLCSTLARAYADEK
ncbi:unnamed protein product, partial [Prorocentrum cordatum]